MDPINLRTDENKHLNKMDEIKSRYDATQKSKIANATKQFESILTQMMIKSMNQTSGGMLGEEGYGNDMFDTIFEQKMASYMSNSKSMGIADLLYKKITGEEMTQELKHQISQRISPESMSHKKVEIKQDSITAVDSTKVKPSVNSLERLNRFEDYINDASDKFGIDKNIIKSIIMTESAANHKAVSSAKAKGLMQLMDSTATDMGVRNSFNPKENILGGTKYFAQMLRQYDGDLKLALAAYNAGPSNVDKYNGVPPFDETQNYINKVLGYLDHFKGNRL